MAIYEMNSNLFQPVNYITTSWDDGHVLDFKLAERLQKHGLKATFYIPRTNAEHPVMTEAGVQELAKEFEIGGHTLTHTRLKGLAKLQVQEEVRGCYNWLGDITGMAPTCFCFPGGALDAQSIATVWESGFKLARTTELLSLKTGRGLTPTTLQIYPHSRSTYIKHLAKRRRWQSLVGWMKGNCAVDLLKLTNYYLNQLPERGGCFHLWGHSWEIEEYNLWPKLDALFGLLAQQKDVLKAENRQLLQHNPALVRAV